jgi:hypothetical protein
MGRRRTEVFQGSDEQPKNASIASFETSHRTRRPFRP